MPGVIKLLRSALLPLGASANFPSLLGKALGRMLEAAFVCLCPAEMALWIRVGWLAGLPNSRLCPSGFPGSPPPKAGLVARPQVGLGPC